MVKNKRALDYSYDNQDLLTSCLLFAHDCLLLETADDTEDLIRNIPDKTIVLSQECWDLLKLSSKTELR